MFKKILLLILVCAGVILLITKINTGKVEEPIVQNPPVEPQVISLCFLNETPSANPELKDVAWLKMNLVGDKVTGEFRNLPAEKDSKVGTFMGTVTPVIPEMMGRIADVWWDSMAEGMLVTEELRIMFGEGTAQAGFAEMVDRGDGVYVYKDKENIGYWQEMNDVSCEDLDDRVLVEKYIRENAKTLVPEQPTLGGTWYATKVTVDYLKKTGKFSYEDGHVDGSATFSYSRNGETVLVTDIKKI